ncbi:MAG: trmD [Bacteriovoracaceae bacterium]|nr:trmD [Bacteriovoracaceae bacterium]
MKFSLLTIHPSILAGICSDGLLSKAQKKNLLKIDIVNIRDFADAPHFKVDDKPYGGGPGMVLKCEPIARAVEAAKAKNPDSKTRVIVFSAKGKKFNQTSVHRLLKYEHLILICGRYEGIDERIADYYADEEIRIGDYVLMGGEVAAGVVVEAVGRQVPGVLGNPNSLVAESFSQEILKEHAQYTRPPVFDGHEVPEVLLEGNHSLIEKWRAAKSSERKKKGT